MNREIIVQAEDIVKEFHGKDGVTTALDHLNLTIYGGTLTALVGPDGAGKTTFMRLTAGLMVPTGGMLRVLGMDTDGHEQEIQDAISYMPQKFGLYEDLTVRENMDLYADLHGIPPLIRPDRFKYLLEMMGLYQFTDRLAGKLSGGMKQKLALACTLVRNPRLLLLDEPSVGVDPLSRRELWDVIGRLVDDEGLSVIVNTSYMDEAEKCGTVYVMNRGRILMAGHPDEIRAIAGNRCFYVNPPRGMPTRILQGILMDDRTHVVDAVPEGDGVRFIKHMDIETDYFVNMLHLPVRPVKERLEDGFMILLHADIYRDGDVRIHHYEPLSAHSLYQPAEEPIIEVKELIKRFGAFTAVDKTTFTVRKGEVFGLLGPNGAGKTTTFRMLCGLLPMTDGYLSVAGVNLRTARTEARANIGYVAQKFSLYGNLTVRENLEFFGGAYGLDARRLEERIQAVLQDFELEGKEYVQAGSLPNGFKQRLSMAAALLHEPKILFLDEPTSGIDPLARRDFWRQITALSADGTTIIITTHFMEEAEYCDRMMIQDQGRLLVLGTPQDIRHAHGDDGMTMNDVFIAAVESWRSSQKGA